MCQRNLDNNFLKKKSHCPQLAGYFCSRRCHRKRYSKKEMDSPKLACVANVSVRFRSKERGTRVKHCAKDGASKRAGRGVGKKVSFLPLPLPPLSFFGSRFISRAAKPGLSLLRNQTKTLATQATRKCE